MGFPRIQFVSKRPRNLKVGKTAEDDDGNVGKTIRQKAHVNMWNKADMRAVLLSCETSIAPFPRCLQNVVNIPRINVNLFV